MYFNVIGFPKIGDTLLFGIKLVGMAEIIFFFCVMPKNILKYIEIESHFRELKKIFFCSFSF